MENLSLPARPSSLYVGLPRGHQRRINATTVSLSRRNPFTFSIPLFLSSLTFSHAFSRIEISIAETLFHRKIKIKLPAELYDYLGFNPRVLASIFSWISFAIRRGISTSGRLLEFRDSTLAFERFSKFNLLEKFKIENLVGNGW